MDTVSWIGAEATPAGLTVWAVARGGLVLRRLDQRLTAGADPAVALTDLLARELPGANVPVLACGLEGAAPVPLPCPAFDPARLAASGARLWLLPDLVQATPAEHVPGGDALRIAGCLAASPGFDGVICLTGRQTIWAHVSAGEVVSVLSVLSGEVFAVLSQSPWLAAALAPGAVPDLHAFDAELPQALSRPERLLRTLSQARNLAPPVARARVQAALLGAELAAARPWWLGRQVLVLGGDAPLYARGLAAQGVAATTGDAEAALLAGMALAAAEVMA
jgi:2-dehydro-3-deoxygalactonokinase